MHNDGDLPLKAGGQHCSKSGHWGCAGVERPDPEVDVDARPWKWPQSASCRQLWHCSLKPVVLARKFHAPGAGLLGEDLHMSLFIVPLLTTHFVVEGYGPADADGSNECHKQDISICMGKIDSCASDVNDALVSNAARSCCIVCCSVPGGLWP